MKMDDQTIAVIVERIVALLSNRQSAVYCTKLPNLMNPVDLGILARHGNMIVEDIDANTIVAIARCQTEQPQVNHLFKVITFGVSVTLVIHPSLYSMLPVKILSTLPFHWQTKDNQQILLWDRSILAYRDVCQLSHSIVVTTSATIITAMAKDTMTQNNTVWFCSEDTLWI